MHCPSPTRPVCRTQASLLNQRRLFLDQQASDSSGSSASGGAATAAGASDSSPIVAGAAFGALAVFAAGVALGAPRVRRALAQRG
jgi:hypothetical protein